MSGTCLHYKVLESIPTHLTHQKEAQTCTKATSGAKSETLGKIAECNKIRAIRQTETKPDDYGVTSTASSPKAHVAACRVPARPFRAVFMGMNIFAFAINAVTISSDVDAGFEGAVDYGGTRMGNSSSSGSRSRSTNSGRNISNGSKARDAEPNSPFIDKEARIFAYKLPDCSFDHFLPHDIDGLGHAAGHSGRPPALPIHEKILNSAYMTDDPEEATLLYIPAPFFLWDYSFSLVQKRPRCIAPVFSDARLLSFGGAHAIAASLPGVAFGKLANSVGTAWTVSLWVRLSTAQSDGHTIVALLAMRSPVPSASKHCGLGLRSGCPVFVGCTGVVRSFALRCGRPDANISDGAWHHVAASYDSNAVARIYVDALLIGEQTVSSFVWDGLAHYGGTGGGTCRRNDCWRNFNGDLRDLRMYSLALDAKDILWCSAAQWPIGPTVSDDAGPPYMPPGRTTDGYCFQLVREHVERLPWLQRRGGWDHFVLFAGVDYPSAFDPLRAPADEHYVLEQAWPVFGHFSVLSFGARTERCFGLYSQDPSSFAEGAAALPLCVRRMFRTVTIPPLLPGEPFDCESLSSRLDVDRPTRVSYRGLAYGAMVERNTIAILTTDRWIEALHATKEAQIEFTNWTHERVATGACTNAAAFDGLCPWRAVGAKAKIDNGWSERAPAMKRRSLQLWGNSESCLVLPGDGGYELRLYSMINLGCIPVIVYMAGTNAPKLPFSKSVPWHEFAIFWGLGDRGTSGETDVPLLTVALTSGVALIWQLASLGVEALKRKRKALLQYAPVLLWAEDAPCSGVQGGTLDFIVGELMHRARMPKDHGRLSYADWERKIPFISIALSSEEDVTGNGCPLGFPLCYAGVKTSEQYSHPDGRGDTCHAITQKIGWRCPAGCQSVDGHVQCAEKDADTRGIVPCRNPKCAAMVRAPAAWSFTVEGKAPHDRIQWWTMMRSVWNWQPRIALMTFSTRPEFVAVTRPSVERFLELHPGRYEPLLNEGALLDSRDFAPAWNKLALIRRALVMGGYDAVVWLDDDVVITDPASDPIYDSVNAFVSPHGEGCSVMLSQDERHDSQAPFNGGVSIFKDGIQTIQLIDKLFQIARKRHKLRGRLVLPRIEGTWDQDAVMVFQAVHGSDLFMIVGPRSLQSFISVDGSFWRPGDFSAHFTGAPHDESRRLELARDFVTKHQE